MGRGLGFRGLGFLEGADYMGVCDLCIGFI